MNKIIIDGNVTADPTVFAPQGSESSCLSFTIANNDESKPKPNEPGQYEKIATFIDVTYWTKNPQHWLQQIVKGAPVTIQGRVKQDHWNDKETQQPRSKIKIIAQAGFNEGFGVVVHHRAPAQGQQQQGGFQAPPVQGQGYQGQVHNTYGGNGQQQQGFHQPNNQQQPPAGSQVGPNGF